MIPTGGTSLNAGGQIHLVGARLDDGNLTAGDVTIASGGRLFGAGTVGASVDNSGTVETLGGELVLSGDAFMNQPAGELRATPARVVDVRSAVVTQLGLIDVRSNASMLFAMPLVNQANATITLLDGSLGAAGLTNDLSAEVYGFGTVESNTTNDGDMTFVQVLQDGEDRAGSNHTWNNGSVLHLAVI